MQRPLRVLLVAKHLGGGIRTHIGYTYGRFDPSRYSLAVIAVDGGQDQYLGEMLQGFNVDCTIVPKGTTVSQLGGWVRRSLGGRRFDLIHAHGLTAGVAAVLGNLPKRVPLVVTHHGVFEPGQLLGLKGRAMAHLLPLVLSGADCIVLVTEDSRMNLLQGAPGFRRLEKSGRLSVIPNGIDTSLFRDIRRARTTRVLNRIPIFGFLGRFMPEKGFDTLIQAIKLLDNVEDTRGSLIVRCISDGAFIREYREVIEALGLSGYFEFTGLVRSVGAALCDLDAVVMPSQWEAGPLLPMEALTAGCPILVSDCIGLREVTSGTAAIVVRGTGVGEWATAMTDFLRTRVQKEQAALDYAPLAEARYDAKHTSLALQQTFERVLQAPWCRNGAAQDRTRNDNAR